MKSPRFLFVVGVGTRPRGAPDLARRPSEPSRVNVDADGSWVAWRLTGANHRELGRSSRVFADLTQARADAQTLHERIAAAQPRS